MSQDFSQNFTKPKAILFDNDGVLIASEHLHMEAWGVLLKELGIPFDPKEFAHLIGKTAPQTLRALLDHHKPGWKAKDYDLDALALKKNDHYLTLIQTKLKTYPGIPEGLRAIRAQGIQTAVVSNGKRRELEKALKTVGIFDLFDLLISRDDASKPKPDPAPYIVALQKLGHAPTECLAIEDSPTGLGSSTAAGIPTVAVCHNYKAEELAVFKPVLIERSIEDFFRRLKFL